MTDYLGPLTLGTSGTYVLTKCDIGEGSATLEVIVSAATADALATAMESLIACLSQGNTYAHHEPGTTLPAVYRVSGVSGFKQDALNTWLGFWQRVSFTLALTAMPTGALATLYDASNLVAPGSVVLDTLLGTHATMPDLQIDDDSGLGMHSVHVALAPAAVSDAMWMVSAAALDWTTMSAGSGVDAHGNASRYTTSAAYQTALLDTSGYPMGKYRLMARVKQAAGTGYVKDSQRDVAVAVTRATPHFLTIGDLDLPSADTAYGTAANLMLSVKSDGTNRLTVDLFLLIPLSWGYFGWHSTSPTDDIASITGGPTGQYQDGAYDATYRQGSNLVVGTLAAHVSTMVTPASPAASWPDEWGRTSSEHARPWFPLLLGSDVAGYDASVDATYVGVDGVRFRINVPGGLALSRGLWFPASVSDAPLVLPGSWLELSMKRQVSRIGSGSTSVQLYYYDIDGNLVTTRTVATHGVPDPPAMRFPLLLGSMGADVRETSDVSLTVYDKVPVHASRVRVQIVASSYANLMAYYSDVVLRRCPMRVIVAPESASGALVNYAHPTHLTLKYVPRWEVARGA